MGKLKEGLVMSSSIEKIAEAVAKNKMEEYCAKPPIKTLAIINNEEIYNSFLQQDISEELKNRKSYPRYLTGILFKCDGVYVGLIKNSKEKYDILYQSDRLMLSRFKIEQELYSFDIFATDEYGVSYVSHSSILYKENSFLTDKLDNYFFYADIVSSNYDEQDVFDKFEKHMKVLAKMYTIDKVEKFDNLNNWFSFYALTAKLNNGCLLELAKTFPMGRVPYYPEKTRF